jgi:predicted small secreted protein
MNRKIALAAAAFAMLALSACNTIHGAGKDMTSAGKAVSKASGEK